ncbi:catechol 2,3-dioxygenase-like lactoylglutathione lyase family enzyme [Catenulispora sp. GAS73]|uniref:VOC family protein n=1 Tax=Catenulispora sp. GAS73 TaxID=3156269 RepID=UPI00351436B8
MAVELNHTIVPAHDPEASAQFLADILGLAVGALHAGHAGQPGTTRPTSSSRTTTRSWSATRKFDAVFARIQDGGITYYGDPACQKAGHIYTSKSVEGRRGTYFRDPNGHLMEILTAGGAGS